jgi:hypothetical protein
MEEVGSERDHQVVSDVYSLVNPFPRILQRVNFWYIHPLGCGHTFTSSPLDRFSLLDCLFVGKWCPIEEMVTYT